VLKRLKSISSRPAQPLASAAGKCFSRIKGKDRALESNSSGWARVSLTSKKHAPKPRAGKRSKDKTVRRTENPKRWIQKNSGISSVERLNWGWCFVGEEIEINSQVKGGGNTLVPTSERIHLLDLGTNKLELNLQKRKIGN